MKQQNIKKAYLSISSPGVYLNVPSSEATKNAAELARRVNVYASQLKKQHPEQFGFFASLPLPDIPSSLEEIDHCLHHLDPKPDGFVFMSNAFGLYLGDPAMDAIYKVLNDANATIFEHPTTPCTQFNALRFHTNSTAPPITPSQWQTINRPIADRQFTTPLLDFPFDTARTFTDLFVSRVPARFDNIKWIIPHAGGGIFSTIDRLINYGGLLNVTLTDARMKDILAKQFFFDLAGPWPVTRAIPTLLDWVEHTRILWGSDAPWTPWAAAAGTSEEFEKDIRNVLNSEEKAADVGHRNAENLFTQ